MKYFNLDYWIKLWVFSAPLFQNKKQGINAESIDNIEKIIKDWDSKNTTSIELNYTNNYQTENIDKNNKNLFYENLLKTQNLSQNEQELSQQEKMLQKEQIEELTENEIKALTAIQIQALTKDQIQAFKEAFM